MTSIANNNFTRGAVKASSSNKSRLVACTLENGQVRVISSRIFIDLNWLHIRGARNVFTESDDENLIKYIAKVRPVNSGRLGNNIYITLEESVSASFAYTGNYTREYFAFIG